MELGWGIGGRGGEKFFLIYAVIVSVYQYIRIILENV